MRGRGMEGGRTLGRYLHSTPSTFHLKYFEYSYISPELNYSERLLRCEILTMDVL